MSFDCVKFIDKLESEYGLINVERILELKFGTLDRWRKNPSKMNKIDKAMLRVLSIHPELLLRVADNKFKDADKILVDEMVIKPEIKTQERIENKPW